MSDYTILPWDDENASTGYPFTADYVVQDCVVDASFIQFDGYQPQVLNLFVDVNKLDLTIQFDTETRAVSLLKSAALAGNRAVRIYTQDNSRYLGCVKFGPGVFDLWQYSTGRTFEQTALFDPSTVRGIPSQAGVYSFDNKNGAVTLSRSVNDQTVFYNISIPTKTIIFNAVTGHEATGAPRGLRRVNLVTPHKNAITLLANETLKFKQFNNSLTISLVAGKSSSSFSVNTLNS